MNRRRAFISLLAGATATWPLAAPAQQVEKVHRVGFLWDSPIVFPEATDAFRQGLRDLGYIEGRRPRLEPTDETRVGTPRPQTWPPSDTRNSRSA